LNGAAKIRAPRVIIGCANDFPKVLKYERLTWRVEVDEALDPHSRNSAQSSRILERPDAVD
jgi:hypothetical protein